MRHLLELGAHSDYRDDFDLTALHHAVLSGFEDIVDILLQRGADVNSPSVDFGTPLILAVLKERSNIVQLLLKVRGINLNAVTVRLGTALHCAAGTGNLAIVKMLLEPGAGRERQRRLRMGTEISFPLIKALSGWTNGTEGNTPIETDTSRALCADATPLLIAVWCSDQAMVELVCADELDFQREWHFTAAPTSPMYVAPTKRRNSRRYMKTETLLSIAVARRKAAILTFLLEKGIEPDHTPAAGYTAIMRAAQEGSVDCTAELLKRSPSINRQAPSGQTALSLAARSGYALCVRLICEAGASTDIPDSKGDTALHWAARRRHVKCATRLLEYGASVDCKNGDGFTPLFLAIQPDGTSVVSALLHAGASTSIRAKHGVSILHELLNLHRDIGYTGPVAELVRYAAAAAAAANQAQPLPTVTHVSKLLAVTKSLSEDFPLKCRTKWQEESLYVSDVNVGDTSDVLERLGGDRPRARRATKVVWEKRSVEGRPEVEGEGQMGRKAGFEWPEDVF